MKGQVEISTVELVAARLEREAEPGVVSGRLESFHDHRCDSVPANHNVTYAGGSPPPIGLEEALDLTGFGRFSVKLVLGLWLCMTTQNFTGTDIAYSLPAAQCDLQFTAMEKGWVNAALYVGMMSTAFVWGALSDRVGRKYPLVLSYAAMAVCSFINAMFVSTAWAFLVCRVFMGAMLIATATLSMTYAGELFGKTYRARVFMWGGTLQAFSAAGHAGLAMWIIPLQLSWLRSWRVFMLLTTLINAVTGLFLLLLPESPKSLAVRGRQRESIGVLASIFSSNTGLPADCYPVRSLTLPKSLQDSANEGNPFAVMGRQFVKLCRPPYRIPLLFAVIVQPLILYCQNTIRMWVPTIFAEMERDLASGLTQSRAVCNILEDMSPAAANVTTYTNCEAVLLTETSRGWSRLVISPGMITRSVFSSLIWNLTESVRWPLKESRTSIDCLFRRAPGRRAQTVFSQSFVMSSLNDPDSWARTWMPGGNASLGRVFLLKRMNGGSFRPSAVIASMVVNLVFSFPVVFT
ncbi:synaptic vesicle glycoprotein 2C-like isoform X2 [Frankliniella occidentalis]|uniref:Synaptic vesicle glycoprotein 2C-like isoform X2 n=1 Tax=Frankliniella occidentalis TaxID=133901 RepID=A0A9C6WVD8_FRAOC|nr:synaptic vesicle glycoprotein 2C-like isoform X2 [Frankliniella occidentalis]